MSIRIIAENGELEDQQIIFIGAVAPVFVNDNTRILFIDVNGEYLSIAYTSLRGENYQDELQMTIKTNDEMLYKLLKRPVDELLLLTVSDNKELLETIYISLDDKAVLPLGISASKVGWDNNGKIIYVVKTENNNHQIWLRNDFESQATQLTNEYRNWF